MNEKSPDYLEGYEAGYECLSHVWIPLDPAAAKEYVQGYCDGTQNRVTENSGDYLTF